MDQCERRLQDARTARDGDRAEQAAAMAAANARNVELQKALQQLQARLNSSQAQGLRNFDSCFAGATTASRACTRQLQTRSSRARGNERGAELRNAGSSCMTVMLCWSHVFAAITAAAKVYRVASGDFGT